MWSLCLLSLFAPALAKEGVSISGRSYATEPWEATFTVDLDGKEDTPPEGSFAIRVHPEWAPEGAKRFQDMVEAGILKDARFFRVVPNFMVQFGIPGDPQVARAWRSRTIPDDVPSRSNARGMVTFATSGRNSRTTQMFINSKNNRFLDGQGFAPFAEVLGNGMEVVDKIQSEYGEKPSQPEIQASGNKYLKDSFPALSFVGDVTEGSPKIAPAFLQLARVSEHEIR